MGITACIKEDFICRFLGTRCISSCQLCTMCRRRRFRIDMSNKKTVSVEYL